MECVVCEKVGVFKTHYLQVKEMGVIYSDKGKIFVSFAKYSQLLMVVGIQLPSHPVARVVPSDLARFTLNIRVRRGGGVLILCFLLDLQY